MFLRGFRIFGPSPHQFSARTIDLPLRSEKRQESSELEATVSNKLEDGDVYSGAIRLRHYSQRR